MYKKGILLLILLFTAIGSFIVYVTREQTPEPLVAEKPQIIAHRGANDRVNESTIPAYELAATDGVDALEIDLRMSKDGSLVAMHDETIDRTTEGSGEVSNYTLDELKGIQTVEVFSNQVNTEPIPTLKEIIDTFTDTEHYYIETRLVDGEPVMEEPLIQLLQEHNLIDKGLVTIQSFSQTSLEKVKELAPDVPLTLLFSRGNFNLSKAKNAEYPIIGMESTDVTLRNVNELHRQGKEVHVFFNDKATQRKEQKRVKEFNVDGYFTDDIAFTKELLGRGD